MAEFPNPTRNNISGRKIMSRAELEAIEVQYKKEARHAKRDMANSIMVGVIVAIIVGFFLSAMIIGLMSM